MAGTTTQVDYKLLKGDFSTTSPVLPQRLAVLCEANTANQTGLITTPVPLLSATQIGNIFGFGSPAHAIARILKPSQGGGIECPVDFIVQGAPMGANAKVMLCDVTGTASKSGTFNMVVAGRRQVDGGIYSVPVTKLDTATTVVSNMKDAINRVLSCPFTADNDGNELILTAKWAGATSDTLNFLVDTNGIDFGLTFDISTDTSGTNYPTVTSALNQFVNTWYTYVINGYGTNGDTLDELEAFNGVPDPINPTGRYTADIWRPFIALTGSIDDINASITSGRKDQVTISIAPAPLSQGQQYEAAANMAVLACNVANSTPQSDILNAVYADMPTPLAGNIPAMTDIAARQYELENGASTVDFVNSKYVVKDFITTYHPDGEEVPQFRYCRNLQLDYNVKFTETNIMVQNVYGKTVCADSDIVTASNIIKPKQIKSLLQGMFKDLAARALIADVAFSNASVTAAIDGSNPDKIDVTYRYKRTGVGRITDTEATAGFNYGTI